MSNTIRVVLTLDGKQYSAEIDRAGKDTDKLGEKLKKSGTEATFLSTAARAAGISLAGLGAANIITSLSRTNLEFDRSRAALDAVSESSGQAGERMRFVSDTAERLGLDVLGLTQGYARLTAASKGTNLEGERTDDIFAAILESSARLRLGAADTAGVLRAVEQIMSKGTLSAEELRQQLGDRLPGAFNIAARALGVTTEELNKMLVRGEVASDEFLPKFAAELRRTFNTDLDTRIDLNSASFQRLTNEIKLLGDEMGRFINDKAGPFSEGLAFLLQKRREFLNQGDSRLNMSFSDARAQTLRNQALNSFGVLADQQNSRVRSANDLGAIDRFQLPFSNDITGASLLSSGVVPIDQDNAAKLAREIALLNEKSELVKFNYDLENGLLADLSKIEQARMRDLAIATDAKNAAEEAAREAKRRGKAEDKEETAELKAQTRERERLLGLAIEHEEKEREATRNTQVQTAVILEELRLGRQMGEAERALFELRVRTNLVTAEGLDIELRRQQSAEQTLDAQAKAQAVLDQFDPSRGGRGFRRDLRGADSGDAIDQALRQKLAEEQAYYFQQLDDLQNARDQLLSMNVDYNALEVKAWRDHEDEKTRLTREANEARRSLMVQQVNVFEDMFGNLADTAQAFGEKGFKAYKAFAVAEATASMISGAVGAFARASAAFPPPAGQIIGAAAAAAVVASSAVKIAQIRAMEYGGGRQFGGPVDPSRFYEVNEKKRPEILESGGRFFLMDAAGQVNPARSGNVSGAAGIKVEIFNYEPVKVGATTARGPDGDQVLKLVIGKVQRDFVEEGPLYKTLQGKLGLATRPVTRG